MSKRNVNLTSPKNRRIMSIMAQIIPVSLKTGGRRFRVVVDLAGQRRQHATFLNLSEARKWAAKTESACRRIRYGIDNPGDHKTVSDLVTAYRARHKLKRFKADAWEYQVGRMLDWWINRIGCVRISSVTPAMLTQLRDDLAAKRKAPTVNKYVEALRHVFSIGVQEWEWLKSNPFDGVRRLNEGRGRSRFLTHEERGRLLRAARSIRQKRPAKPIADIITLAICTGARKSELLGIKWRDVDLTRGLVILHDTKNGESRPVYLSDITRPIFERALTRAKERTRRPVYVFQARFDKKPMDIDIEFRRAVKQAGIEDFTFHDLRHTAASYLAMNGATHSEIAEVLGHKTLNMVKRYAHLSKTHTASVVGAMNVAIWQEGVAA